MRETWYVLEDGSYADPREVVLDDRGMLRHKDGVAVSMRFSDCPRSRGMSEEEMDAARKARAARLAPSITPVVTVEVDLAKAISDAGGDIARPTIEHAVQSDAELSVAKGPGGRWFVKRGDVNVSRGCSTEKEAEAEKANIASGDQK